MNYETNLTCCFNKDYLTDVRCKDFYHIGNLKLNIAVKGTVEPVWVMVKWFCLTDNNWEKNKIKVITFSVKSSIFN